MRAEKPYVRDSVFPEVFQGRVGHGIAFFIAYQPGNRMRFWYASMCVTMSIRLNLSTGKVLQY